jgi:hypothetical protein
MMLNTRRLAWSRATETKNCIVRRQELGPCKLLIHTENVSRQLCAPGFSLLTVGPYLCDIAEGWVQWCHSLSYRATHVVKVS